MCLQVVYNVLPKCLLLFLFMFFIYLFQGNYYIKFVYIICLLIMCFIIIIMLKFIRTVYFLYTMHAIRIHKAHLKIRIKVAFLVVR